MKILGNLEGGQELVARKNGGMYEYYLDGVRIGVFDPNKMEDKILFIDSLKKENTRENEASSSIRDEIEKLLEDIDKDEIMKIQEDYTREEIENMEKQLDTEEKITKIELLGEVEKQKDEKKENEKENNEEVEHEENASTLKDVYVDAEVNLNTRVGTDQTVYSLLKASGKLPELDKGENFISLVVITLKSNHSLKDEKGNEVQPGQGNKTLALISNKGRVVPLNLAEDHSITDGDRSTDYHTDQYGNTDVNHVYGEYQVGYEVTLSIKNSDQGTDIYSEKNPENDYVPVKSYDGIEPKQTLYSEEMQQERTLRRYNNDKGYDTDKNSKNIDEIGTKDVKGQDDINERTYEVYESLSEEIKGTITIHEVDLYVKNHGEMETTQLTSYIEADISHFPTRETRDTEED